MWASRKSLKWRLSLLAMLASSLVAQSNQPQTPPSQQQVKDDSKSSSPDFQQGLPTFKVTTRNVIVDVVARDKQGNPVRDLTEKDFQIFEHLDWIRRVPQKIASFRPVNISGASTPEPVEAVHLPAGVATNLAAAGQIHVPPVILLIDEVNTYSDDLMSVGQQINKMIDAIPENVPVAIYLLDGKVQIMQSFTLDHGLLHSAAAKAFAHPLNGLSRLQTRPTGPSSSPQEPFGVVADRPSEIDPLAQYQGAFVPHPYGTSVAITTNAFLDIARHLAGYPVRKNLIWISDSFPTYVGGGRGSHFLDSSFSYWSDYVEPATNALSNARISVYPINANGLSVSAGVSNYFRQATMQNLADDTGGRACMNSNDLSGCVTKAMDHGLTYYELSYSPKSASWLTGFHRIMVKTTRPGVHLSYRHGYYADNNDFSRPKPNPNKPRKTKTKRDPELQRVACDDSMTATSLPLLASAVKPDRSGEAKYAVVVDAKQLTFIPQPDGNQKLQLDFAACTFDRTGLPLKYMQDDTEQTLKQDEFQDALAHGFPHMVEFSPPGNLGQLRLVVRDAQTGLVGSVDMSYAPFTAVSPAK
jgi:VWFA-related protein